MGLQFGTDQEDSVRGAAALADSLVLVGVTEGRFPAAAEGGDGNDGFLARVGRDGAIAWVQHVHTNGEDIGMAVAVAGSTIFIAGTTTGNLTSPNDPPRGARGVPLARPSPPPRAST